MSGPDTVKYRVSNTNAIFLVSAAITIDIVQALLNLFAIGIFLNRLISPFTWLFFVTWFYFLGVKFTKGGGKNAAKSLISLAVEMVPILDLLPGWTVSNLLIISTSRLEDKGVKSLSKKKGDKNKKSTPKKSQLNNNQLPAKENKVGSEIKTPKNGGNSAQKELNAVQTAGNKTSNEKLIDQSKEGPTPENKNTKDFSRVNTPSARPQKNYAPSDDAGALEELSLEEDKKEDLIPSEQEGGQDKQEFSMGDPYRESIDINPKRPNVNQTKNKNENDDSMKMAA